MDRKVSAAEVCWIALPIAVVMATLMWYIFSQGIWPKVAATGCACLACAIYVTRALVERERQRVR